MLGERQASLDNNFKVFDRTFIARYESYGALVDAPWTSPGNYYKHEAMMSVSRCGTQVVAGGWSRDEAPDSDPVPLMRWIETDGTSTELHGEPMPNTQTYGIGCDREGKIVSSATRWAGQYDARVFALADTKLPAIEYDGGDSSQDGMLSLACDEETGFCAAGGFRTADLSYAWLRVYHP